MRWLGFLVGMLMVFPAYATELNMPTWQQRQEAGALHAAGDDIGARAKLEEAVKILEEEQVPYVRSNERRYVAEQFYQLGDTMRASKIWRFAMEDALSSPYWNRALYGAIGVLEIAQNNHALQDVHDLGLLAVESGLLKRIADTGESAETGRFFVAMNHALSEAEIAHLRLQVAEMPVSDAYKKKALHALGEITARGAD